MNRPDTSHLLEAAQRFLDAGQLAEAREHYQQVCQQDAHSAAAWLGLGRTLLAQQQAAAAASPLETAARLDPQSIAVLESLGACYLQQQQPDKATAVLSRIIELEPDNHYARLNLGKIDFSMSRPRKAATHLKIAVRNEPENIEAWACLCNALMGCDELVEAIEYLERARCRWPAEAGLLKALAMTYVRMGMIAEAQPVYAALLRLQPDNAEAHGDYVYSFCYLPGFTPEERYREHVRWGQRHAPGAAAAPVYPHESSPGRRLRVGYVSADFYVHSVAYFLEPLLANHDKRAVEIFCYANLDKFDDKTRELSQLADTWRNIRPLDDAAAADLVRADEIDILVDLAGHTAGNRLGVFARKPAPVQVSYIGYPATTGMVAMDYRLTDAQADPPGETEHLHTETLVRLPGGFLCYQPPPAPAVRPPPCLDNGYLTFGSFNSISKLNPRVIDAWATLLLQVPGSRLLLKGGMLRFAGTEEQLRRQFRERGIAPERVEYLTWSKTLHAHLDLYNRVDIGLDSFPYNGTTTTCEALWMGVPVVTLAGQEHVSRVGVSLLTQVGLEDWIADSEAAYIDRAAAWSEKPDELANLRQRLRAQMAASGLCDAVAHTRVLETAYGELWQRYKNDHPA